MKYLQSYLQSPIFNDREQTRRAHFLHTVLLFSIPISVLTTILSIIAGWTEGVSASLLGFVLFIVSYIFLTLKKLSLSSFLFLTTLLIMILISTYFGKNIFDSSLFMIPVLITVTGLLLESLSFVIFSISTLLLTILVALMSWENFHILPDKDNFKWTLIITIIYFIITFIATKVLIRYLADSINESKLNEEKFRSITEKLNLGIFTYTEDGIINYANDYFCQNTGYSREEILSMPFIDMIHPDHKKLVLKRAESRLNSEDVIDNYEVKVISKDKCDHWIYITSGKVDVHEKTMGLGGIFDITVKKELEQQLLEERTQFEKAQKLESLGVLAGGIAHDFNNLLTGVLGNIGLIKLYIEEKNDIKIQSSLIDMQKVVKRASNLTNQLLTFSKGGSPILRVASLENIIKENTIFVLSGSNVDYSFKIEKDLWNVNIDTGQISQVIQNLIINADQAMPTGGNIKVSMKNTYLKSISNSSGEKVPPGDYVCIKIKDNGQGIPKGILLKIFDPYFTTKEEGSGLGLATVYSIIEKHNGYLDVKSTQNKGTVFTLYLPKANSPKSKEKETNKKYAPKYAPKTDVYFDTPKRILIMDDEKPVQKVVKEMFLGFNFKVDVTSTGEEALNKIRESILSGDKYDIVLLDLTIPGRMGGKETISHILKLDPNIYSIATSGYSSDHVMANYKKFGFKGILKKPYSIEEIKYLVQNYLSHKGDG